MMRIILSPAKKMNVDTDKLEYMGLPVFIDQTEEILEWLLLYVKTKIDMADGIFVINVGNYIGDSTRSEIEYALKHGKTVEYGNLGR